MALYDDIYRVSAKSRIATDDEVDSLEATLGCQMPAGYREFVTRFGEGVISSWMRVYCPWRIQAEYRRFQERVTEYFFWEEGRDVLSQQHVQESICFADTLEGDELVFHPARPDRLLVLPRNDDTIYVAGETLPGAMDWLFDSGKLTQPVKLRAFEPFANRVMTHFTCSSGYTPPNALRKKLLELQLHDAVQHENTEFDSLEMFVREFGGSVVMLSVLDYTPPEGFVFFSDLSEPNEKTVDSIPVRQIPKRPHVWINHDLGIEGEKFDVIVECLHHHGLARGQTVVKK